MQANTQKALVVQTLGSLPVYTDFEIPQPQENEVLIKVIASTINPSDRFRVKGAYGVTKVPFVAGLEGYGEVVKAGSQEHQKLIGKKVSFQTLRGSWAQYTVTSVHSIWQVDSDVPIECAASGIVNPLTVIGMVDTYQKWENHGQKGKGIINTGAASALGRMLNKYCQREGIPLLNVVRRQEQVKILEEDGAKFILDTSGENWVERYKEFLSKQGFNVLFDAIGGGQVTETLISNLRPGSQVYVYGKLSTQPFILRKPVVGLQGTSISNFMLFEWYGRISNEQKQQIKEQYSSLLKNELSTHSIKQVKLEEVLSFWEEAEKRATEGKITIIM